LLLLQTPSLVPPKLLEQLLTTLQEQFGVSQATVEISMEADPGTFDLPRLQQYKALGVNRLSLGVQSFQEVPALILIHSAL
jgi:oxygen-independent coproporphyrinogen-3 oxidase